MLYFTIQDLSNIQAVGMFCLKLLQCVVLCDVLCLSVVCYFV
jgi:hypothetical protein